MATKQTIKNISVRKNRNYGEVFNWTDELNSDLYNFYLTAKSDPSRGYIKRLKTLWDEKYPNFAHLTEKHLRQHASFIKSKREKSCPVENAENARNVDNVANDEDNDLSNDLPPVNNNTADDTHDCTLDAESRNTENDEKQLISELREQFQANYEKFGKCELDARLYSTKLDRNIDRNSINAMNDVINTFITDKLPLNYWDIDVIFYTAAITLLERHGKLKENNRPKRETRERPWVVQLQNQINTTRRKISHIQLVIKCIYENTFTKKQKSISLKVRKMYGSLKSEVLTSKLGLLQHELNVLNIKLRDMRTKAKRSQINHRFIFNKKQIYRQWKLKQIDVKTTPPESDVRNFWAGIWEKETPVNLESEWYRKLKETYCNKEIPVKRYIISDEVFQKVISKLPNNKAPGTDYVTGFWVKNFTSLHSQWKRLLSETKAGTTEIPDWLVTSKTLLLPKNESTHMSNNYRPIACLNIMYKVYTAILNNFLEDHCTSNDIITVEQAGGKRGSWGCVDQLLIDKMVQEEVSSHRRSIFMMWFDYKKAFDSIPHKWLLEALRLAKVPDELIDPIIQLTSKWATKVYLHSEDKTIETNIIKYLTGVLQGDCLSLLLFILSVNPLSHLLNENTDGYAVGEKKRETTLTHLLFVDDLKTYAKNEASAKQQLKLITDFSRDIGMKFGADKCSYICIEGGKQKTLGEKIKMGDLELSELKQGDTYKYLGVDEDISFKGDINKERVRSEYLNRVRKIWKSELYGKNKVIAHNSFAVPVIVPTIGILNWTKAEIEEIDVKTRKILTSNGSFHRNSGVDRLYTPRNEGGRGLISILDKYVTRMISVCEHIRERCDDHKYLKEVRMHEDERLFRVTDEFRKAHQISEDNLGKPVKISKEITSQIKENHTEGWLKKPQHGYVFRKQQALPDYNKKSSNSWLKSTGITSHVEGYIFSIQEQEINTRYLQKSREGPKEHDGKCRYCHIANEDIFHVLCSCPGLSASLYLPVRHDSVAKYLYNAIIKMYEPSSKFIVPLPCYRTRDIELWWDTKVKVVPSVPKNKPDIVFWEVSKKQCLIIDVCIPLDINVAQNEKEKRDKYVQLSTGLQRLYPEYEYEIIPIVIGATGYVPNTLHDNLKKIGFGDKVIDELVPTMLKKALMGSMSVVKSAMKMKK